MHGEKVKVKQGPGGYKEVSISLFNLDNNELSLTGVFFMKVKKCN